MRALRVAEVVLGAEAAQRSRPGQLVEVDEPQVAAVGEHVAQRDRAGVADPALVQPGGHQVPPSARAACAPERQPSSWKPQPWYAPANAVTPVFSPGSRRWAATEAGV